MSLVSYLNVKRSTTSLGVALGVYARGVSYSGRSEINFSPRRSGVNLSAESECALKSTSSALVSW